ncbi:MAG TPA: general secretion pathway protein GspB [Steroidobacteraceae bacterium]|nr:general secretion pathway protein GspB [Steroidobacteraceae bacterium]
MSFILDALKKSESDRQRQGGPALFEVKIAPPRHALPPWAVAIAVLLVANLGVVAWFLLRHAAAPAHAAPEPGPQALPAPAASAPAAVVASPTVVASPAVVAPSPAAAAPRSAVTAPAPAPVAAQSAAADATAEPASSPDDFAPAVEPPPAGSLGRVKRGTDAGVPLYQQLIATPGTQLPQLRLDLHAYAERPEDRWVLVNMHKLREGESLEGVRVDRITPEGAVLSYQGSQFLLTQ